MVLKAPFFDDVADAPSGQRTVWLNSPDGVRIRAATWPGDGRGSIVIFPGRTEYIEKYGLAVGELVSRGFGVAVLDWRGQGLSDRSGAMPEIGHVGAFSEYQQDIDALYTHLDAVELPRPWYLLAHSMGGQIGLTALMRPNPFDAAVFSGPMWGISAPAYLRGLGMAVGTVSRIAGFERTLAAGQSLQTYSGPDDFADNPLTHDRDMFDYMNDQVRAHPELGLGGASYGWIEAAFRSCAAQARRPSPGTRALIYLGTEETIVRADIIRARAEKWQGATLRIVEGARHEVMMETPAMRDRFYDEVDAFFRPGAA